MAGGRLRINYCRLVVATSAVWFIVDILLFVYFTDCLLPTEKCAERQQQQQSVTASLSASRQPRSFFGRLLPSGLYHRSFVKALQEMIMAPATSENFVIAWYKESHVHLYYPVV